MKMNPATFLLLSLMFGESVVMAGTNSAPPAPAVPISEQTTNAVALYEVGRKVVILGKLGVPIGETVRITGRREERKGSNFRVEKVNDRDFIAELFVDGIGKWPQGVTTTLEGHENGNISLLRYMGHSLTFGAPQLLRQTVQTTFRPAGILEPVQGHTRTPVLRVFDVDSRTTNVFVVAETDINDVEAMIEEALQKMKAAKKE